MLTLNNDDETPLFPPQQRVKSPAAPKTHIQPRETRGLVHPTIFLKLKLPNRVDGAPGASYPTAARLCGFPQGSNNVPCSFPLMNVAMRELTSRAAPQLENL